MICKVCQSKIFYSGLGAAVSMLEEQLLNSLSANVYSN